MRFIPRIAGTLLLLALPGLAAAAQQSFTDLPADNPRFSAAEYLKAHGILQGYEDGTFRPDQPVNRAEVTKVIVLQRASLADLSGANDASVFRDIKDTDWFAPYVQQAYGALRIIDGPPKTYYFQPNRTVTRGEFLKMLLLAYETDPSASYGEITLALSADTQDSGEWFYPYVRYAYTASMLQAENDHLNPAEQLTRGDIADMLYRFLLYREGKRTQTLLSMTENETLTTVRMIENEALDNAAHAAARAVLASRGALTSQPDDATVKGSVKIAEAAVSLVQAARSASMGDTAKALAQASTAWHLGEKAKGFSSTVNALAKQVQDAASQIADSARN
jgi:hypothetical protein